MTQELTASTIAHGKSRLQRHKQGRAFQLILERVIRAISKGVLAGAILAVAQPLAHAQAPVLRQGSDGRPVMRLNTQPAETTQPQSNRYPILQPIAQTPQLQQINRPQTGTYPQFQTPSPYATPSTQPAFNIGVQPQTPNVQLVAERRGFLDVLMPWRRRSNVPQEYEQPVEPPSQYNSSNPLPANAATEFGPAMSGFNQRYSHPATQHPATPPRTAQATPVNPPVVRRTPVTPPQAAGTATTNDGRELPVFQFGASPATPLAPPRAPRVDPNASPVITSPTTEARPNVTPANPAPPIMPLRSPGSSSPPVSESSSSQQIDPPTFVDPIVRPEAPAASPFPAPSNNDVPQGESAATAFPPPPSGVPASPPVLAAPTSQENTPPAFVPPGAPRIENEFVPMTPAVLPRLSAVPPALTPPTASFAFVDDQQSEESNEDKFARIRERRGQTGLKGFCPVMLRDQRELVDARPEFAIEFNGETYFVSSAEALETFASDPVKYAPAAAGSDIIHRDLTGEELPGSLDHAVWYRGRLYMFATAETLETFVAAPAAHRTDL